MYIVCAVFTRPKSFLVLCHLLLMDNAGFYRFWTSWCIYVEQLNSFLTFSVKRSIRYYMWLLLYYCAVNSIDLGTIPSPSPNLSPSCFVRFGLSSLRWPPPFVSSSPHSRSGSRRNRLGSWELEDEVADRCLRRGRVREEPYSEVTSDSVVLLIT